MPEKGRQRMAQLGTRLDRAHRVVGRVFRYDLRRLADALLVPAFIDFRWDEAENARRVDPAANGLFTRASLAKLYAMLAGGGASTAPASCPSRTVERATEVQSRGIDLVVPFPMHWRLGYHRAATTAGTMPRGFGHYGFGGSGAWADPDQNLSMAMVLNSGIGTPFGDMRTAQIGGVVLRCARRRK
jgi:CubicO group peptidase (beta-lactamase class C family)